MDKAFEEVLGKENILKNEPMSKHSTFKIGGPAKIYIEAKKDFSSSQRSVTPSD